MSNKENLEEDLRELEEHLYSRVEEVIDKEKLYKHISIKITSMSNSWVDFTVEIKEVITADVINFEYNRKNGIIMLKNNYFYDIADRLKDMLFQY